MSDVTIPGESSDAPTSTDVATRGRAHRVRRHLIEWVILLIVVGAVTVGLRTYVFQTYFIPSGSMEPTLQIGDRILVDKLAVEWGTVNRGDIIVFKAPDSEDCGGVHDPILVKRVIGLPGDSLYSIGNTIYVNGKILNEAWTHTEPLGPPAIASPAHPVVVAANHYFMVGDNHSDSCDSRYWGTITHSAIIGKAFFRIWPLTRLGFL